MRPDLTDWGAAPDQTGSRILRACLTIATLTSAIPLLGWIIDAPALKGLGQSGYPAWPISLVGFLFVTGALAALERGVARSVVVIGAAPPLFIGLVAMIENLASVDTGLDRLLFGSSVMQVPAFAVGRPGFVSSLGLVFLPSAVILSTYNSPRTRNAAYLLASLALGFGAVSLVLLPQTKLLPQSDWHILGTSFPAALTMLLLALGLLSSGRLSLWRDAVSNGSPEWKLLRLIFPLILVAPIFAAMLEMIAMEAGLEEIPAEVISTGANILVLAALFFWSTGKVVGQRGALQDLNNALDCVPVILTGTDGRIIHWSHGCENLYGWKAQEAEGRTKHELLRSRTSDGAAATVEGMEGERELVESRRDGSVVHVLEQGRRVNSLVHGPIFVASMTDIGARVEAEQALRESEQTLALATSAHGIGTFEWDVESGRVRWSRGSEERLGFEAGTLDDLQSWGRLVHPEDKEAARTIMEEAAARHADGFTFKYRVARPTGPVRVIEASSRCVYDEQGKLVRTVGVNIDVTEREERSAALEAREAQLRSVLETVPSAMVVIDEAGTIRTFSRAAEELFGYPASEAVGENISLLMGGEHKGRHSHHLARYLQTGERRVIGYSRVLTAVKSDGTEIPIELRVGEAVVGGERLFTGFVRDISDRIETEERMNTLRAELAHASRVTAMGELAAGLAHELNQPLAASVNFLAAAGMLLNADAEKDRIAQMLQDASRQNMRAGEIIRRLREFVTKGDVQRRPESVEETIREAVELVIAGRNQFEAKISYAMDPKARTMLADRVQIQQVLFNLLRNSIEALEVMPREDRNILVSAKVVDDDIEISVSDTGPGIPASVLSRIYTPFTSTKGDGGMGIGLSVCRRIIEAHGGELVAENRAQGGACFRFTVPTASERELQT